MSSIILFIEQNQVVLIGAALALSELLALNPKIKANSIFQLIANLLKSKKK